MRAELQQLQRRTRGIQSLRTGTGAADPTSATSAAVSIFRVGNVSVSKPEALRDRRAAVVLWEPQQVAVRLR